MKSGCRTTWHGLKCWTSVWKQTITSTQFSRTSRPPRSFLWYAQAPPKWHASPLSQCCSCAFGARLVIFLRLRVTDIRVCKRALPVRVSWILRASFSPLCNYDSHVHLHYCMFETSSQAQAFQNDGGHFSVLARNWELLWRMSKSDWLLRRTEARISGRLVTFSVFTFHPNRQILVLTPPLWHKQANNSVLVEKVSCRSL